jgi:hypothetical protein
VDALRGGQPMEALRAGSEAVGHGAAAMLPVLGPIAADIGEQGAQGDVAGAVGRGAGLLTPFAGEKLYRMRRVNPKRANLLEREATQQVSERVLAPGNPAYKGKAQKIAPEVLSRKLSGGRMELQQAAEEGMAEAGARIDDAIQQAGGVKAPVPIVEIEAGIRKAIADLRDSKGVAYSDQAAARIKQLEKRLVQVRSQGGRSGMATFEDLRGLRDENYRLANEARGYERLGNVKMADEGWAARETGSVILETFARRSPAAAAANADFTFWKTLNDVLDPVKGRPKSQAPPAGVTGGARTSGAVAGALISPKVAFVMGTVVPFIRERMADASWQLADAQSKMKLAQAMKQGDIGRMRSAMAGWAKYSPKGATSPMPPSETAPAR